MDSGFRVSIIGLGYVGLPLAVAMARHHRVTGFDANPGRVTEIAAGHDRTGEVSAETLAGVALELSADPDAMRGSDAFIITVPTPVDASRRPDLEAVVAACRTIGPRLGRGALVVLESTVWPGVTEEVCGPELERTSGLAAGKDFALGYSPERMNPGDPEHGLGHIVKVVAGQTAEARRRLAALYGPLTEKGLFFAKDIRTAEAAKVIENAQRDINIAFVNEVAMMCHRRGLDTADVLAAAATKWNFLPFEPGLVGGHCIGVDPYYLAHWAQEAGHAPQTILAGRRINDAMGAFVADEIADLLAAGGQEAGARVLVLGLTFKENVPDLRNSQVIDIVRRLEKRGHRVRVHDPLADPAEAALVYGLELLPGIGEAEGYDAVIGAVAHRAYRALAPARLARMLRRGGVLADVKGIWRALALPSHIRRWAL